MSLKGKSIGFVFTGSFCTYRQAFRELEKLVEAGAQVQTVFSDAAQSIDSRFGAAADFLEEAGRITGNRPIRTIPRRSPSAPAVCSTCW